MGNGRRKDGCLAVRMGLFIVPGILGAVVSETDVTRLVVQLVGKREPQE